MRRVNISRRKFISATSLVLGGFAVSPFAHAQSSSPAGSGEFGGPVQASDLELATLTDTSVALTWATYAPGILTPYGLAQPTVPADEEVLLGPSDGKMEVVHYSEVPNGYHHVVITGLEPGREYRFDAAHRELSQPHRWLPPGKQIPRLKGRFLQQSSLHSLQTRVTRHSRFH